MGHLVSPFESFPLPNFSDPSPLGWSLKRIAINGALFSTSPSPKGSPIAWTPTSHSYFSPYTRFASTTRFHWSLNKAPGVSWQKPIFHPWYLFLCWTPCQFTCFCLHHGLVSPRYPFTTQQWGYPGSLRYPPFSYSFLWRYKSLPGSSKNLHTEFGFLLDFTSMLLLFSTLQGIKYFQSVSKRARYTFTITVLQQIYSKLPPFHSQDVDSSILWAAFTLPFFRFLRSINFTWNGKFWSSYSLIRADVNFKPNIFSPNFLEIPIKKSKTYPFHETAKLTITGSNSMSGPSLSFKTINFKHTVRVPPILSSNSPIGTMLPAHRLPTICVPYSTSVAWTVQTCPHTTFVLVQPQQDQLDSLIGQSKSSEGGNLMLTKLISTPPKRLSFKYPRTWHLALTDNYLRYIENTVMSR